jgi:hypothetical protein
MPVLFLEILIVGNTTSSGTSKLVFSLAQRGYRSRHVDTVAEAQSVLEASRFGVVLATETLPDGRGYDLSNLVASQSGYLFVGVLLSETLWLPVVERGSLVLGQRALNASVFESEVDIALGAVRVEINSGESSKSVGAESIYRRVAHPKRRGAEAA